MERRSSCRDLREFLSARRYFDLERAAQRQAAIRDAFAAGEFQYLPGPLGIFLQHVHSAMAHVEALMLWGSHARGDESQRSFSLHHGTEPADDYVVRGPSDVDALLVTTRHIPLPPINMDYERLTGTLASKHVRLNLFRDVFQVPADDLATFLTSRRADHLSCILDAWLSSGIVLIGHGAFRAALQHYSHVAPHRQVVENALEFRFARMSTMLGCTGA